MSSTSHSTSDHPNIDLFPSYADNLTAVTPDGSIIFCVTLQEYDESSAEVIKSDRSRYGPFPFVWESAKWATIKAIEEARYSPPLLRAVRREMRIQEDIEEERELRGHFAQPRGRRVDEACYIMIIREV